MAYKFKPTVQQLQAAIALTGFFAGYGNLRARLRKRREDAVLDEAIAAAALLPPKIKVVNSSCHMTLSLDQFLGGDGAKDE